MIYFKTDATNLKDLMTDLLFPYSKYTYYDKNFTGIQCHSMRRRSFRDLHEIAVTYFPETTEKELMQVLTTLQVGDRVIWGHYCRDVGGAVFSSRSIFEIDNRIKNRTLSGYSYYKGQKVRPVYDHELGHYSIYQLRKLLKS